VFIVRSFGRHQSVVSVGETLQTRQGAVYGCTSRLLAKAVHPAFYEKRIIIHTHKSLSKYHTHRHTHTHTHKVVLFL